MKEAGYCERWLQDSLCLHLPTSRAVYKTDLWLQDLHRPYMPSFLIRRTVYNSPWLQHSHVALDFHNFLTVKDDRPWFRSELFQKIKIELNPFKSSFTSWFCEQRFLYWRDTKRWSWKVGVGNWYERMGQYLGALDWLDENFSVGGQDLPCCKGWERALCVGSGWFSYLF